MDTFILKGNETVGPLTREEVLHGLADGTFSKDDFCAREGWSEWRKIGDVYHYRSIDTQPLKIKRTAQKGRNWRDDPVTERQRDLILSKGMKAPKTKGEASDLISSILGTGPSPRQIAKLEFLGISCTTKEEVWAILDAAEGDPSYEKKIAEWDKQKAALYPDLYFEDGSYKDQKANARKSHSNHGARKKKTSFLTYVGIVFGILLCRSWLSDREDEKKSPEQVPSYPLPSSTPILAVLSESTPLPNSSIPTPESFPELQYWPDKIHLLKPLKLTGAVGGGVITTTIAAGTLISAELSSDHKTIIVHNLDLCGSVPIKDTDFIDRARKTMKEGH